MGAQTALVPLLRILLVSSVNIGVRRINIPDESFLARAALPSIITIRWPAAFFLCYLNSCEVTLSSCLFAESYF